jgi:HK97 gp10 family phage protein
MPDISIEVQGLAELQRRLDDLRTEQATRILRKGLRAGAKWIQTELAEQAPVRPVLPSGTALPPGALKSDMVIRTIYRGVAAGAAVITIGPGKFTAHVARWVEFGHRLVAGGRLSMSGRGKGHLQRIRKTGKTVTEANPFMRRAFETTEAVALSAFQTSVKSDLDKLQTPGGK